MRRYCLIAIFTFLSFFLTSFPQSATAEHVLGDQLQKVERYGKEGKWDFAFLELRSLLREYPDSPRVPEMEFALAEYLYRQRNYQEARETFLRCLSKIEYHSTQRFLGQVYLLKCQEMLTGDSESARKLLSHLKHELSSQQFFEAFDEKRTYTWHSPLGNDYILYEFVDRMEIIQNGKSFYTITIP